MAAAGPGVAGCAAAAGSGVAGCVAATRSEVPAAAVASPGSICRLIIETTASMPISPSPPLSSIEASSERTLSTMASRVLIVSAVTGWVPSRSRDSSDSPAWVTDSRLVKARKPLVPLMVWIVRKMRDTSSRDCGCSSSETRSRSSWSRFSWLSTRNSWMMSSRPSTGFPFP